MNKLQKIFSDHWAVRPHDLQGAVGLLMPSILRGNLAEAGDCLDSTLPRVEVLNPYEGTWWELGDSNIPADSLAVVSLQGMLYSWATEYVMGIVAQVEAHPQICGMVLVIDGPGGMASYVDQCSKAIRSMTKPTATYVKGIMASAHFWLGTSTGRTFIADSPLCEVGSVGVVVNYYSFRTLLENAGIKHWEIYPDSSDLKNREVRDLEDNDDETLIKQSAARLHEAFSQAVSENTGIAYDPAAPLFRGQMFTASEAVGAGIINQTGTLKDAILWVLAQAALNENN